MLHRAVFLVLFSILYGSCSKPVEKVAVLPTEYDIVIMPTEEFPISEANQVAATVAQDTGLQMKVVLPMGIHDWKPFADRPQFDAIPLMDQAQPVIDRLKGNYGGKVYVILTSRDIGPADRSLNFHFTLNNPATKVSVVSAARLLYDENGQQATHAVIQTRLRKILLRTIALQYYDLPRSADINDVTYSPLMSLTDLDQMGLNLKQPYEYGVHKSRPQEKDETGNFFQKF